MQNDEIDAARRAAYKSGARPQVKCLQCENTFPYKPQGNKRKFCSAKCRVYHNRAQKKALDNQKDT